jgi:hypothetical protein
LRHGTLDFALSLTLQTKVCIESHVRLLLPPNFTGFWTQSTPNCALAVDGSLDCKSLDLPKAPCSKC